MDTTPARATHLAIRDFVIAALALGVGCGWATLGILVIRALITVPLRPGEDPAVLDTTLFMLAILFGIVVLFRTAASGIYVRGTTVKFRKVFYTKTVDITDIASMRLSSGTDTWPVFTLVDGTEVSMPSVAGRRVVVASNISSLRGKLVKLRDLLVSYGATDLTGL